MIKHRPKIEAHHEDTEEGEALVYRVACACGDQFPGHFARTDAVAVRDNHRSLVAPPESERCRSPKVHRTRWWDACPLCTDQLVLPFLEEIA